MRSNPWLTRTPVLVILPLLFSAQTHARYTELPTRIPEPAPYESREAQASPPPFESHWNTSNNPALCASCHTRIFEEWNGSQMANSWRDPAWRAAFLLISRLTATDGNCDIPSPPDGTEKARLNPFADLDCSSSFDLGTHIQKTEGSGSLLDEFCSRCHMPTNYVDQFALEAIRIDEATGMEHATANPRFDPTSDNGTGLAYATVVEELRNTTSGKLGISCAVCHTQVDTRYTPYHTYERSLPGTEPDGDRLLDPAPSRPGLGYAIGAGAFRLSPKAITTPERFGPLTRGPPDAAVNSYVSEVFGRPIPYERGEFSLHPGSYHALMERGEQCGSCHDVTNPLPIKNPLGRWVGGFPIERTYSEWAQSRYADRPGNPHYDPDFKRDCQSCHMQQDYGRPGTASALYAGGEPVAPLQSALLPGGPIRQVYYSHHFVGGNAYVSRLIGKTALGSQVADYPELSSASFSSADPRSPYNNAFWVTRGSGEKSQHARLAWDRLRNLLHLELDAPRELVSGSIAPVSLRILNEGAGHKFPTGFPEGRNAWVALRAFDTATGAELQILDMKWDRISKGVGYLTDEPVQDPNFPQCDWIVPAGSPDPYAYQMRAVATLGDGCPTLALPYATALNLVVNEAGLPIDERGLPIGRDNPLGKPRYRDLDGDGDLYDDNFLLDTRLRPLPHPEAALSLDRYSILIPEGVKGPVAVTAAVYYQSLEAMASMKFLGNLADLDLDMRLEPGVLGGAGDGRIPDTEPAVVEGAPPVPLVVRSRVIAISGQLDNLKPGVRVYPADQAADVYRAPVIKASFSEPVTSVDAEHFRLLDAEGAPVPAFVEQIGDGTWALFPHQVFLREGEIYRAELREGICDFSGNCLEPLSWSFEIARKNRTGSGDTRVPPGFIRQEPGR